MIAGKAFNGGQGYSVNHLSANDYYEKGQTIIGEWIGLACEAFGVSQGATVTSDAFEALRVNMHVQSGEPLTRRTNSIRTKRILNEKAGQWEEKEVANRRNFFDFTVSAPKSFSVAAVTGGDGRIREWHSRAVKKAIREMELYTSRRDHSIDGLERTGAFCAAHYSHDANRSLEPQMHDHIVIFNATPSAGGNNYALDPAEYFYRCKYLTAIYRDELAAQALQGGYDLEIDDHGAPQLKNMSEISEHFSSRGTTIDKLVEQYEQLSGTSLSQAQKKLISFASRGFDELKFKRIFKDIQSKYSWEKDDLLKEFLACISQASDGGLSETTTEAVIEGQRASLSQSQLAFLENTVSNAILKKQSNKRGDISTEVESLSESIDSSVEHHFERKSVVKDYDILASTFSRSCGKGLNVNATKSEITDRLQQQDLYQVDDEITTKEHLEAEKGLLEMIEQGTSAFDSLDFSRFSLSDKLNSEQRAAVNGIVNCSDQFQALVGRAGTGKTFSTSEIVRANIEAGYNVFLCAPSNGARDVLRSDGEKLRSEFNQPQTAQPFLNAQSLQKLLLDTKLQASLPTNSLIILDEAGLASVKQLHQLGKLAKKYSWRVLHVGDPDQHTSVEAGDGFRIELQYSTIARQTLKKIQRQSETAMNGAYRQVARDLSTGNVSKAFELLDDVGAITETSSEKRYEQMAIRYIQSIDAGRSCIVVNPTHRENDAVSQEIRELMIERGTISNEREMTTIRSLDWTQAEKKTYSKYQQDMIIEVTAGRNKGQVWTVTKNVRGRGILCESNNGTRRFFTKDDMANIDVCQSRKLRVGIGDKLMMKTGQKVVGGEITNGEVITVGSFDSEGTITATDGRVITTRKFIYGYASTSHKSQGATCQDVIIGFDRHSVKHADKKLAYVAGTRGVNNIHIYVENKSELVNIAKRTGDRKAALELNIVEKQERIMAQRHNSIIRVLYNIAKTAARTVSERCMSIAVKIRSSTSRTTQRQAPITITQQRQQLQRIAHLSNIHHERDKKVQQQTTKPVARQQKTIKAKRITSQRQINIDHDIPEQTQGYGRKI